MECPFCKISKKQAEAYVIYESENIFVCLDIDPINEGHVLIVPKLHEASIDKMPLSLLTEIMETTQKVVAALKEVYNMDGYSIMQNGGEFCDFGHGHFHVFPRYKEDGFGWKYPEGPFEYSEKVASRLKKAMNRKLLLFDLDGTLLRSDKTISEETLEALQKSRDRGMLIGVSTSRSEQNCLPFVERLKPDIMISSGGALVRLRDAYIYKAEFSTAETQEMIATVRKICGEDCEITMDTVEEHYWNYRIDPKVQDVTWGDSIYTDFKDFDKCALKMCVEIFEPEKAKQLQEMLADCDCVRFSDGYWYKFTKKDVTKEKAILEICRQCDIEAEDIIAFGDDFADIGMLQFCGTGIAMGNAIEEVKAVADKVIGGNDEEGIAKYLEEHFL